MTDMNLGEAISRAVAAKLDAAFVEKEVETRVEKLVIESINQALRSYSETGKLIEKAVEQALRVDKIDLPSYGATVSAMLKAQIEASVATLVAGKLAQDMAELLGLAPAEVKLSQIAEEMLQQHKDDGSYGECISVIVERSDYGGGWVYLDEGAVYAPHEKYKCAHRLAVDNEGSIYAATIAGHDTKKAQHIGRSYGLEQKLRAYVACGTKLILDEDFVSIGVGDY